jgi:hypothetical protein
LIEAELVMTDRTSHSGKSIDRETSWSICEAVGERLQQSLRPESSHRLPRHLENLVNEMRRRDDATTAVSRTRPWRLFGRSRP